MTQPAGSQGKAGKRYRDVAQMVREVVEEKDFADDFEKHLAQRQIVKFLMTLRAVAGMSQADIAEKLKCSQSRISKLESSIDSDLRISDLASYAAALGFKTEIMLIPPGWTAVKEVKYHALCIKRIFDHLAGLAEKDHSIAKGVANFFNEARFGLGRILQDSAKTVIAALLAFGKDVPPCPEGSASIKIEKKETESEQEPEDEPPQAVCEQPRRTAASC